MCLHYCKLATMSYICSMIISTLRNDIIKMLETHTIKEIALKLGCSKGYVSRIKNRKTYKKNGLMVQVWSLNQNEISQFKNVCANLDQSESLFLGKLIRKTINTFPDHIKNQSS